MSPLVLPAWLTAYRDVGGDTYISSAQMPADQAPHAAAIWTMYDRLFGAFTGASLDPQFHRLAQDDVPAATPMLLTDRPLLIVGAGPSLADAWAELRAVRDRIAIVTSLRGALLLQAQGLRADVVLIEHPTPFDAQVACDERRYGDAQHVHLETTVVAARSTPPELLASCAQSVRRLGHQWPSWGVWPATAVALGLSSGIRRIGLLGVDLGTRGMLDPVFRPQVALLEYLSAKAPDVVFRDCGALGAYKACWPRATLQELAAVGRAGSIELDWRDERDLDDLRDEAMQDLECVRPLLPSARAGLDLGLIARAGHPPADRDLLRAVEEMLAWGQDATLRTVLQRGLGLSFLPRFWRTGIQTLSTRRIWRPLVAALHELTSQADRLEILVDRFRPDRVALDAASRAGAAPRADASTRTPVHPKRVSVLLPVKNGLPHLANALASLVMQTHPDVEILVIDDGSDDGGPQLMASQTLSNVRVVRSNGQGLAAALNTGLRLATGAFIARQDADDWSHPERLARQFQYLLAHPEIDVLATCADIVDHAGRRVDRDWVADLRRTQDPAQTPAGIAARLPLECCLAHGSIMARREVFRLAGGYRPSPAFAQEYDLWLRLLPQARFAKLPTRLYTCRVDDDPVAGARQRDEQAHGALHARFDFITRLFPALPSPASVAIAGDDRETAAYRRLCADLRFTVLDPLAPYPSTTSAGALERALADADLLIVANPSALTDWAELCVSHPVERQQVGNVFVRTAVEVLSPVRS